MKTIFRAGLVALAVLGLSSCAKEITVDQVNPDTPIEFGTYLGRAAQTKGSEAKLDETPDVGLKATAFGVYAYYTEDKGYDTYQQTPAAPNFMVNEKVSWVTNAWTYSPVKYWPNEDQHKVSFFAYAPYFTPNPDPAPTENITAVSASDKVGNPTVSFTVASDVTAQKDLLYASHKDQTKANVGVKTQLTFKHALSRIGFKAQALADVINTEDTGADDKTQTGAAGTLATETKVKINSIKLNGKFYKTGTLDLTNGAWTSTASTDVLVYELASDDLEVSELSNTDVSALLNKTSEYMMIIPAAENVSTTVTVDYDVITSDSKLVGGTSTINNVITSSEFNFKPLQGQAYTFVLHIGLKSVELNVQEVSAWDDQTNDVVNVPKLS